MRMIPALAVLCSMSGVAAAQGRLATSATPDAELFAAIWPLPHEDDGRPSAVGSFGLGFGAVGDAHGAVAEASGAAGMAGSSWFAVATSRIAGIGIGTGTGADRDLAIVRGRHAALATLRTRGDLGLIVSLGGVVEHGDPPALSALRLGTGRRTTGDAHADAQIMFDPDDDESLAFAVRGDAGATRWEAGGAEHRLALAMALGYAPADDELPRGMLDFVRARVEHAAVRTATAPSALGAALGGREVRRVDLGVGAHEMTLAIDHELAAVIDAGFGWAWVEADAPGRPVSTNLFTLRLGADARWRQRRRARLTHVGLGIARQPDYLADASRLVKDWRLELTGGIETPRLALDARGGVSWLVPATTGPSWATAIRYGSELSAFVKVGAGLEVGGYHAVRFEPAGADPWASHRAWSTELGAMIRIRTDLARRSYRPRPPLPPSVY